MIVKIISLSSIPFLIYLFVIQEEWGVLIFYIIVHLFFLIGNIILRRNADLPTSLTDALTKYRYIE